MVFGLGPDLSDETQTHMLLLAVRALEDGAHALEPDQQQAGAMAMARGAGLPGGPLAWPLAQDEAALPQEGDQPAGLHQAPLIAHSRI